MNNNFRRERKAKEESLRFFFVQDNEDATREKVDIKGSSKKKMKYKKPKNKRRKKKWKMISLAANETFSGKFVFTFTETGVRKEPLSSRFKGASR